MDYFKQIGKYSTLIIEQHETYQKQTYRNRCYILSAQGILPLIIPVNTAHSKHIKDVKIDYTQKWMQIHLRAIQSCYGKSAFFEYLFPELHSVFQKKHPFLWDFNLELLSVCLMFLKLPVQIAFTQTFTLTNSAGINDCRNKISPDNLLPTATHETDKKYYQLFGNVFVNNLSIIDLLFNEGTNAKTYLLN